MIAVAVRWYLRYGLSYRGVQELLAERAIEVDHVTIFRWVQTFTAEFIDAARPTRHAAGDRWFVDETYVRVAGRWAYLYRAVDQHGQVIDVLVSTHRDARRHGFFPPRAALRAVACRRGDRPSVGLPGCARRTRSVCTPHHRAVRHAIEADHSRLKARLRPMRRLKSIRSLRTVAAGQAFVQNLRRGHYAITTDLDLPDRVRVAFDELALTL